MSPQLKLPWEPPHQGQRVFRPATREDKRVKRYYCSSIRSFRLVAELFQRSEPAWSILFHIRRRVIEPRVAIRLVASEQEVNRAYQFVGQGNDRLFVSSANHQAQVFRAKYGHGSPRRIGCLTEQVAQHGVALSGLATFYLARAIIVDKAQAGPQS